MSGSDVGTGGGAGEVVRQGHLKKLKTMKKKYFVLRAENAEHSARLEYYESEKKFRAGATPRRVLSLKSCYNIIRRLDLKQRHVIALFTREEQFCIVADNEQELHAWLAAILKHHRSDETSGQLHHPIQHVWQVNVQKKGLGAVKNIHGLYNLCLTDKTLTLVKIKSQNNVISELGIPERVEYSLKNIRRCGDSECFFYMEVGRQTTTGAGELWMLSEDSNIAQSMHSTIYHAMRNCARETENERDHIVLPKGEGLPARRQTYSDGRGRAGLTGDAGTLRNRCDSMPSRACSSFEIERPPPRHNDLEGLEASRDEPDAVAEWYRTPRIPEEPDVCDVSKDLMNLSVVSGSSIQHSRTSSLGVEDAEGEREGYLRMRAEDLEPGRVSSSASVCSGTPSTDPRFSEYNLEPATSHITGEWRPPRAYSVGSRPTPRAGGEGRHRAYSVGARGRPAPRADDLMLLDFSSDARAAALAHHALHYKTSQPSPVPRTPPRPRTDEYVDMSPRGAQGVQGAGYVLMTPGEMKAPAPAPATPEGYVEMSFGRAPTRPIAIAAARAPPPATASPDDRLNSVRASHGSQIFEFSNSLESPQSPQSPAAPAPDLHDDDTTAHTTPTETEDEPVQEVTTEPLGIITLDKGAAEVSCSPQYVTLKALASEELPANPTANKLVARQDSNECNAETNAAVVVAGGSNAARFSVCSSGTFSCSPLHYAALDLEPRRAPAAPAPRAYTQIDFVRSEKLHAYDAT